jgi:hypothetical protein
MFEVSADETTKLARTEGMGLTLKLDRQDGMWGRPGVTWTRLALLKPADPASE